MNETYVSIVNQDSYIFYGRKHDQFQDSYNFNSLDLIQEDTSTLNDRADTETLVLPDLNND